MLGLRSFVSASSDAARRARVDVATRRHREIGHPHREARLDAKRRPEPSRRKLQRREAPDGLVRTAGRTSRGARTGDSTRPSRLRRAWASALATGSGPAKWFR
jgi:hypothetical protein